jgi:cation diffusion facilitator CzcD-associated flavoprotein CzcO
MLKAVEEQRRDPSFVIIGAGISGILMGVRLLERGYRNFVIL